MGGGHCGSAGGHRLLQQGELKDSRLQADDRNAFKHTGSIFAVFVLFAVYYLLYSHAPSTGRLLERGKRDAAPTQSRSRQDTEIKGRDRR
jgi:hypothetical protein